MKCSERFLANIHLGHTSTHTHNSASLPCAQITQAVALTPQCLATQSQQGKAAKHCQKDTRENLSVFKGKKADLHVLKQLVPNYL